MAWRPHKYLMHVILDNRVPGKVTGVLRFQGMDEEVRMDLDGDVHRDIRGTRIYLCRREGDVPANGARYMQGMATFQIGKVGDITAGQEPDDYVAFPYIERYSEANGRIVLDWITTRSRSRLLLQCHSLATRFLAQHKVS